MKDWEVVDSNVLVGLQGACQRAINYLNKFVPSDPNALPTPPMLVIEELQGALDLSKFEAMSKEQYKVDPRSYLGEAGSAKGDATGDGWR